MNSELGLPITRLPFSKQSLLGLIISIKLKDNLKNKKMAASLLMKKNSLYTAGLKKITTEGKRIIKK